MERAKAIEELREVLKNVMASQPQDGRIVLHLHGPLIIGLEWDQVVRILSNLPS
jgi:hypothetical protein